jgi:hypothetical protein
MANQVHKFKDTDVKRVIKAARAAGLNPTGVEVRVKDGIIRVFGNDTVDESVGNPWDQAVADISEK